MSEMTCVPMTTVGPKPFDANCRREGTVNSNMARNGDELQQLLFTKVDDGSNEPAVLQEMFRKLACSLCEAFVSHTSELRIEATVGVTVDGGARVVLVHFADRVSRKDDSVVAATVDPNLAKSSQLLSCSTVESGVNAPTLNDTPRCSIAANFSNSVDLSHGNVCLASIQSCEDITASNNANVERVADVTTADLTVTEWQSDDMSPIVPNTEQRLLRQLLCSPPVLKRPCTSAGHMPAASMPVKSVATVDEVVPCKPAFRSTILGKLLTSLDSDSYMSMCHPQHSILANTQFMSTTGPVHDDFSVRRHYSCSSTDDGMLSKRVAAKRLRNLDEDDDDYDWEPTGGSRHRSRKQQEQLSNSGIVSRSMLEQQFKTLPTSTVGQQQTSQYQFSNLLHHLVERNLTSDGRVKTEPSDPHHRQSSKSDLVISSVSSLQQGNTSKNGGIDSIFVKQEFDDASYVSNLASNLRTT